MKKFLVTVVVYTFINSVSLTRVFAVTFPNPFPISFEAILERAISLIPAIITLVFAGLFFWGGYTWMTAYDNEEKLSKARAILLSAITGLLLIFLARPLLAFLESFLIVQQPVLG